MHNLPDHIENPSALAIVVRREAPSSGKPGDKAIINHKGEVDGWIGGGCTRGIVIKEALAAINDQQPRLVKIQPGDDTADADGVKNYRMTCLSGGSVEIYIEPIKQTRRLVIFGRSHIARALALVAKATGYEVDVVSNHEDTDGFPDAHVYSLDSYEPSSGNLFAVVCTQGEDDEISLKRALELNATYVAFVASKRKSTSVITSLSMDGVDRELLKSVQSPAGLDIQAKTPEEVAISIMAQMIQVLRSSPVKESMHTVPEEELLEEQDLYINPVCKIPVSKTGAKHIIDYKDEKVYFCCDGCKESFVKDPASYMEA